MERYKNLNGNSNVIGYECGYDYIRVQFSDYSIYTYSYSSAGEDNVEEMKRCARRGYGLQGYINRYCKFNYEK